MKRDKYFSILRAYADSVDPVRRFRHTALIAQKGNIIAMGFNQLKSHPLQKQFGKNSESIYLHAEIDAIRNALRHVSVEDLTKCDLYVIRVDRRGHLGNSKPCAGCQRALIHFGLRNVIHS